jgi:phage tail tape-measure protein
MLNNVATAQAELAGSAMQAAAQGNFMQLEKDLFFEEEDSGGFSAGGAAGGAVAGFAAGAAFGPVGMVIGAIGGALIGGLL